MNTTKMTAQKDIRDHGYAWVVLISSLLCNILVCLMIMGPTVFLVSFIDAFGISTYQAGWIVSIYSSISATGGVFGGILIEKFSCKSVGFIGALLGAFAVVVASQTYNTVVFIVMLSFISAFCVSLTRLPPLVIIQLYFLQKRPFATGISLAGYSIGNFALPLLAFFIEHYGWRGALMLKAGLCLNMCIFMMTFSPSPCQKISTKKEKQLDKSEKSNTSKALFDFSILKNPTFLITALSFSLFEFGADTVYKISAPKVELDLGVDKLTASTVISAISLGEFISRILSSIVANLPFVNTKVMYSISILTGGGVIIVLGFVQTYTMNMAVALIYGLMYGTTMSVQTTVLVDLLGVDKISQSQGLLTAMYGTALLLTVPFAGWMYDSFQNFVITFVTAGIIQCLGGVLSLLLLFKSNSEPSIEVEDDLTHNSLNNKENIVFRLSESSFLGSAHNLTAARVKLSPVLVSSVQSLSSVR